METPIELSHVNVADNSSRDRTVYETLRHHRIEDNEYMTINTALEGDASNRPNVDKKIENIETTLIGQAKYIKILKVASIILAMSVVVSSVSFGVLLHKFTVQEQEPVHTSTDGYWADWSSWGTCSTTCGNGTWTKTRTCTYPAPSKGGKPCLESNKDIGVCNLRQCPVHGHWSVWGKWRTCSASCGQGLTHRRRTCTNPRPSYDGNYCFDDPIEYAQCMVKQCQVDGGWSEWLLWSSCSVTCGAGQMNRQRLCSNPRPEHGGHSCTGNSVDSKTCQLGPCAVDGGWSVWSVWGSCSVTCGVGQMTRQRLCVDPRPEHGGHNCTGNSLEQKTCHLGHCTVDGGWSVWSVWGSCSVTCGIGQMTRHRLCVDPPPANGGQNCTGNSLDHKTCNHGQCTDFNTPTIVFNAHHATTTSPPTGQPLVFSSVISNIVDGGWSVWSVWGSCSVTCGVGQMTRQRLCVDPRPEHGGHNCTGNSLEQKTCHLGHCTVDGGWSVWSVWGSCSVTCGIGQMTRHRLCVDPPPANGGQNCTGNSLDHKTCNHGQCTDFNTPTIVFNAHHATTTSPPTGQPLVFSSVISNIGNGYSSSTGKSTAPVNGTYSFTVQLCVMALMFILF